MRPRETKLGFDSTVHVYMSGQPGSRALNLHTDPYG